MRAFGTEHCHPSNPVAAMVERLEGNGTVLRLAAQIADVLLRR